MVDQQNRLERYLDLVRARLPGALVSDPVFAQIRTIGTYFPELPLVGFETHLGSTQPTVDLFLLLDNCTADQEYPGRANPIGRLPEDVRAHPAWRRIIDACETFRNRSDPVMHLVTSIWLEFDIAPGQPPLPTPSIFMGIRDLRAIESGGALAASYTGGLEVLIRLLTGEAPRSGVRALLRSVVEKTAAEAAGYHVGAMLSRGADAIRLCVRRAPVSAVLAQLRTIGWTGGHDDPEKVFARYFELMNDPTIHADIGTHLGPKLGFDLALARSFLHGQPRDEPRWHEMFEGLVSEGLATSAKRDALLAWPGGARLARQESIDAAAPPTRDAYLIRGLNHVKVVCDGNGGRSAKGYFAYQHLESADVPAAR
jgi:hypothetical protein